MIFDDLQTRFRSRVTFASSVSGGPLERLVRYLEVPGKVVEFAPMLDASSWRAGVSKGTLRRVITRARTALVYPVQVSLRALRGGRGTLVVTTNPPILPPVSVLLRPLHGQRVVVLVYDLYPEALEAAGYTSKTSLPSLLWQRLNRLWISAADAVVFIGHVMESNAVARYGSPKRHLVIETGADAAEFPSEPPVRAQLVLSYVGNLGAMHDWETLAGALGVLEEELVARGVEVRIAASGSGAVALEQALRGHRAVSFTGSLDDEAWRELMLASSISLVTLREGAEVACVPSKAFSAMAAGCALLAVAPSGSDLAALVASTGCGDMVAPGDVDGLVKAIRSYLHDPQKLRSRQLNARKAAVEQFDTRLLASRWRRLLEELDGAEATSSYEALKRVVDLALAVGMLGVTWPVLLLVALAIRTSMGRPILFSQERAGRRGQPFRLFKFRTMTHAPDLENDPSQDGARLTPLGRWLRSTSLDELPSLFNVLKGELSFVGPRPLPVRYLPRYSEREARRHEVTPGLTGLAQVCGRNALSWGRKFELDVWYVENRSILLDLAILARTALVVLRRDGISSEEHVTMPEFMGHTAVQGVGDGRS